MEIYLDSLLLCSPNAALGRIGPLGMSRNGQQIVDDVAFFRAAERTFFARGSRGVQVSFAVEHQFASYLAAEVFFLTWENSVSTSGRLKCVCGVTGSTQDVYLEDCVVETVAQPPGKGVSVTVQYTIKGPKFSTDVPAEPLPSADPEEKEVSFRRGSPSIANAATFLDVSFSSPLASAPTAISVQVSHVSGDDAIDCEIIQDSISTEGFTVNLSAPAPNGNYKLHYLAFL